MKIAFYAVTTAWSAVALYWLGNSGMPTHQGMGIGGGIAVGNGLAITIVMIRDARTPKPPRKPYPTTPR